MHFTFPHKQVYMFRSLPSPSNSPEVRVTQIGIRQELSVRNDTDTVDGWNPAPPGMYKTL